MGILSGNPTDEPMHYGEVFGTWSYLMVTKGTMAAYQTFLNHAGDEDLRNLLEEAIDQGRQEVRQIEELLKENGIGLPPTPAERPEACLEEIPVGARFQDQEIATALGINIAATLVACSQQMGQSIREDIIMMFAQFHTQKAALGARVLRMTKEKGWLVPPPLHHAKVAVC